MSGRAVTRILALSLLFGLANSSFAHHSHSSLDRDDVRLMTGVVTQYLWRSPHVYIKAEVRKEDGKVVEYTMEMNNPMSMARAGWDKDTWAPGDRIIWQGAHDRDASRAYMGLTWAENADGARLYIDARAQKNYLLESGQEIPDYLDDSAVVAPAARVGEGTWSRISASGGRFKNIYTPEPAMDWPLTDLARAKVERFDEADNPINQCVFNGPPRAILSLPKFQWVRADEKTITIDRDLWPQKRVIHLDQNASAGEPTTFGHSVGTFDGEVLHVRTDNFVGEEWALFWGIDSSDQLSLEERYWLSDNGMRLNVEFTITDPVMLKEPVTLTHQWKKIPDSPIAHAECSLENANFFITAGYN